ncbi:MAG: 3-oxoacyl-[acyl-carrier-protein] reductase [candidate division Zixibacteria bacterium]|nr:3-oxoacyl-[acyl-carrier-protein] reductase [candidate division Zixibacteria bacterium]
MSDQTSYLGISGKTALVTGSARGIGFAIAESLGKQGANIIVSDILEDLANEAAQKLNDQGVKSIAVAGNISKSEDVDLLFKTAKDEFGGVDILVNNAGITRDNLLMRMDENAWDSVIAVNLKGSFLCTKAAARGMMKKRAGRIINVASIVGIIGNAGQANYSASKAGIIGLTKSSAKEMGARGVTVNAVAPGYIATDMTDNLPQEVKDAFLNVTPLKRPGTPDDIARAVMFLASDEAAYITGQVLNIDGGMVM